MEVKATVQLKNGARATTVTTRAALYDFFQRREEQIDWMIADINMTRWFYADGTWARYAKFRYVPGRPDLWHVKHDTPKATTRTPFDYI